MALQTEEKLATGQQPQWSADRQWWWQGQNWVPAAQAPVEAPPPPAIPPAPPVATIGGAPQAPGKRKGHKVRNAVIAIGVLVVAAIGISLTQGGGATKSPSSTQATSQAQATGQATAKATSAPATVKPSLAPAAPAVLVDLQGSGIKNSAPFNAPNHWKLAYSYDCSSFGYSGNFQVYLYQGNTLVNILVNELGTGGNATTDVYDGGTGMHLQMNSECSWHVYGTG